MLEAGGRLWEASIPASNLTPPTAKSAGAPRRGPRFYPSPPSARRGPRFADDYFSAAAPFPSRGKK